mmetsp:Transcript_22784/g.26793  ORF Transcript_22784/g.26793 Transcript_22784/m.26793 type:complete len:548 (-) Transcript_22784:101-1744(-)
MSRKSKVSWAKGYKPPSHDDSISALGEFPSVYASETRSACQPTPKQWPNMSPDTICLDDLNNDELYTINHEKMNKNERKRTKAKFSKNLEKEQKSERESGLWNKIKSPVDENDWLAQYAEQGQSFQEYLSEITMRSGRFKSSHFGGVSSLSNELQHIALVPIIRCCSKNEEEDVDWPSYGPNLELLRQYCEIYFNRNVKIMSSAKVTVQYEKNISKPGACFKNHLKWNHKITGNRKIKQIRIANHSAGPSPTTCSPTMTSNNKTTTSKSESFEPRLQILVDPILSQLNELRSHPDYKDCFCVMGITMEDLYSCPSDLFVAGMAAGGSNVAVFSFHRYHPRLKMSPEFWYDFGYTSKVSDYSYYEDAPKKRPKTSPTPYDTTTTSSSSSSLSSCNNPHESNSILLLRAAKLMVHELMHIYGIDHCKHYQCIMNGTGHLVEDFKAPMALCPIDLRKMQWRLAFPIIQREQKLLFFYETHHWKDEAKWSRKRLGHLNAAPSATISSTLSSSSTSRDLLENNDPDIIEINDDDVVILDKDSVISSKKRPKT